jgi:transcription antitermination protein NusB
MAEVLRMRRSRGREVALQALYQKDLNPGIGARQIGIFIKRRLKYCPEQLDYTKSLVKGVEENLAELDKRIQHTAENWRIERMPVLDRNILRLGLYEMQTGGESTPPLVALDEAVELAKRYAGPISGKFINGILDRFLPGNSAAFKFGEPLPEPPADAQPNQEPAPSKHQKPAVPASIGLKKVKRSTHRDQPS